MGSTRKKYERDGVCYLVIFPTDTASFRDYKIKFFELGQELSVCTAVQNRRSQVGFVWRKRSWVNGVNSCRGCIVANCLYSK